MCTSVLRIRLSWPADSSVLVITLEWHFYSFPLRGFVHILFCYINGVVLICDWNENIERLSLNENQEMIRGLPLVTFMDSAFADSPL